MIQINLLPDVKQEFLRARRTRNVAISISIISGLASIGVVVLLVLIFGVQAGREALADNAIKNDYAELSKVDNLSELVTLQNQLSTIGSQHSSRTIDSRLFMIIDKVNPSRPNNVQYTAVNLAPEEKVLRLDGVAESGFSAVEVLKKTIESTKMEYRTDGSDDLVTEPISTSVAIGETSYGENASGRRVLKFEISITYHDLLFSNQAEDWKLLVPNRRVDVTDSYVGVPANLFTTPVKDEGESQ